MQTEINGLKIEYRDEGVHRDGVPALVLLLSHPSPYFARQSSPTRIGITISAPNTQKRRLFFFFK